jgi:hypothetical protein
MAEKTVRNARHVLVGIGLAAVLALVLGSCGGGASPQQTAGIDGSGVRVLAEGPIEAFGSIVVGGRHYQLSDAVIRINGEIASESDLALGQIVVVDAMEDSQGDLRADSVDVEASLAGPVQSVNVGLGTIHVLEQEVRVGPDTVLDLGAGNNSLSDLHRGDYVQVSGFSGAEHHLAATRIQLSDVSGGLRIVGEVEDPDIGAKTFEINNLTVDYSNAGLIEGFPGGGPEDDDEVLVIGESVDASGALLATRLQLIERNYSEYEGNEAEVEGLISRFVSPADFDVAGISATTTAQTDYEGGSEADLQLNVKIQVEGRVNAQGTIVASKIEIKDGGDVH